jgi:hypothetical protein
MPLLVGEGLDGPEELHADVRHDEVGHAEPLADRSGRPLDAGGVGDVDRQAEPSNAVGVSDPGGFGGGPLSIEIEECHLHAKGRTPLRQGKAEARRSTSDHGNGHQPSSGITKSACSRVSFEEAIRHPSAPFS